MIKINMNYFIKIIKKTQIINRIKYINLNICNVDVLSEKLETKVKSSIQKEIMIGVFFLKKGNVGNCCIYALLNYMLMILQ